MKSSHCWKTPIYSSPTFSQSCVVATWTFIWNFEIFVTTKNIYLLLSPGPFLKDETKFALEESKIKLLHIKIIYFFLSLPVALITPKIIPIIAPTTATRPKQISKDQTIVELRLDGEQSP